MAFQTRKSNSQVTRISPTTYARWRAEHAAQIALREAPLTSEPSERLLQHVWLHQRLRRDALRTLDGETVCILHPGFLNREAGPDFRQSIVRIGAGPVRVGDIEIDLRPECWKQHHHHHNPAYANVCLHVVWERDSCPETELPTVVLKDALDAPIEELRLWLTGPALKEQPPNLAGQCAGPLRQLDLSSLEDLLRQAAHVRLEAKGAELEATARQVGWERALWEGLFAALGYKQNVWPMRRLAESLPQLAAERPEAPLSTLEIQARLLGASGLLPNDLGREEQDSDEYLRHVWDYWWREREALADLVLPRAVWRFHGLRPANQPQRRLALAAHWLSDPEWLMRLESWLTEEVPNSSLAQALLARLQAPYDEYWSHHWTVKAAPVAEPQPLLGLQRATDLAVNVILPWFWVRASAGKNAAIVARVEHRYFAWPAGEDNALLRQARARLFGGASPFLPHTASVQQGFLQILRDFCDRSNALCEDCRLPSLVKEVCPLNKVV